MNLRGRAKNKAGSISRFSSREGRELLAWLIALHTSQVSQLTLVVPIAQDDARLATWNTEAGEPLAPDLERGSAVRFRDVSAARL